MYARLAQVLGIGKLYARLAQVLGIEKLYARLAQVWVIGNFGSKVKITTPK
ncbi:MULTISPECIES: hypothetical protein [unclassified Microcoleus]|uniref:hypothetical protein n=1 Tax=unclassified Microcoleus TaxID=2642155 RepID=UPI002FD56CC0